MTPSRLHSVRQGDISIHAPPRGATEGTRMLKASAQFQFTPLRDGRLFLQITHPSVLLFQFTPLREGRQESARRLRLAKNFNSRPSARGDDADELAKGLTPISIHAPPRGATGNAREGEKPPKDFNSRPSARGDVLLLIHGMSLYVFQFTPLREGRRQHHAG